jgi:sugar O-acyltransferase (sialic acid O-acetyltransferase NeuD family)
MKEKKICIIGTGGFGRETLTCLIDSISSTESKIAEIAVFMTPDNDYNEPVIMGIPVIRDSEFVAENYRIVAAIGDPKTRKKVISKLPPETEYTTIIHPSATISKWVEIGEGSIITAGTILTCNIKIGKHAHLNLHATIGHDCIIGDFFTAAPAVNISGKCEFGDCVYFGTNSSVREGIKICNNVTVGMGGIVVKNIIDEGIYIGNPVRKLGKQ